MIYVNDTDIEATLTHRSQVEVFNRFVKKSEKSIHSHTIFIDTRPKA
jgi:hypothetical protein